MGLKEKLNRFVPGRKEHIVADRVFQPISTEGAFPKPIIYGRITKDARNIGVVKIGTKIVSRFEGTQSQIAEQIKLDMEKRGLNF